MSHGKERKEKICLNCGAELNGRYCHKCGQENIEPKESFLHLVNHFVEDITHFDGKFFTTLKDLLFKPGFLSKEYLKGRRASYLHPIRMYVFTSAIFFLIFFSFVHLDNSNMKLGNNKHGKISTSDRNFNITNEVKDSVLNGIVNDSFIKALDTIKNKKQKKEFVIKGDTIKLNSLKEYDSMQAAMPRNKRDGWFKRFYERRAIVIKQNLITNDVNVYKKLGNELIHNTPKMMFILLPLIALVLRLLYIRRNQFLYVDHAIFIIHLFIAIYILWLISYGFNFFETLTGMKIFGWLSGLMFFVTLFYQYKAMRNFYGQSRIKTILKYCLFNFISLIIFIFIGIIFFLNTASSQLD
ncbi:hypothetical protein GALL_200300 [mine drainage metagenome]|uniref:DUF3667 domain-containing protein n=1 Tax=mine drainage metagenome TaxID=410659 RepID=A0A1J5S866_9ZZZZ